MSLQQICFCQSCRTKVLVICAAIMVLTITACTLPLAPVSDSIPVQPESPLIPGADTILTENRWQLVEASYQDETVEFDEIDPIYITFSIDGQLIKNTANCNSDGYYIIAESTHHYRLVPGVGTAKDCGEIGNMQYARVTEAIATTTQYEIQDNQLLLTGANVRIVLEISDSQ